MPAYYNEIDPYAAQWLRNLIKAGHIADGIVDERSIEDVIPAELAEFTQCHFFAGIGVWSLALRRAGWTDDVPVWTGSCPCQPFSAAGKGAGFDDQRHLWPHFHWLISQCQPPVVFGEQVASKDAEPWIDLVQADLEALGYAFGAVPFPAAGVGAPNIRDRLYWMADSYGCASQQGRSDVRGRPDGSNAKPWPGLGGRCLSGRLADANGRHASSKRQQHGRQLGLHQEDGSDLRPADSRPRLAPAGEPAIPDPINGFWRDADWLLCRDGKFRPVEPGTFPLADGAPARVGRLRAYGNAINAEAAAVFIESAMEFMP